MRGRDLRDILAELNELLEQDLADQSIVDDGRE